MQFATTKDSHFFFKYYLSKHYIMHYFNILFKYKVRVSLLFEDTDVNRDLEAGCHSKFSILYC